MVKLGAKRYVCADSHHEGPQGPVRHRISLACTNFWAFQKHQCTHAVALGLRHQRLRCEIFPVMLRGAECWQMHSSTLGEVEGAVVRTSRIIL